MLRQPAVICVILPPPRTPALLTGSYLLLSTLGASFRLLHPVKFPAFTSRSQTFPPSQASRGGQLGFGESSRVASLS